MRRICPVTGREAKSKTYWWLGIIPTGISHCSECGTETTPYQPHFAYVRKKQLTLTESGCIA